jgi:putative oxidoreductase
MNWKKLVFGTNNSYSLKTDIGLLLLRVFAGLSMAFAHGMGKVPPSDGFIRGVGKMGFPMPELFAWSAGLSEFLGAILIAIGFLSRPSAFFLSITMLVAALIKHGGDGFGSQEKPLLYAFVFILIMLAGPGRFSVDGKIRK